MLLIVSSVGLRNYRTRTLCVALALGTRTAHSATRAGTHPGKRYLFHTPIYAAFLTPLKTTIAFAHTGHEITLF